YEYYGNGEAGAGQIKLQTNPHGKTIRKSYNLRGNLTRTWGSGTYPSEWVYDDYGQRWKLHTFQTGSGWDGATWPTNTGTADTTTWTFQESTGLLTAKTDAFNHSVSYTYWPSGNVKSRTWARQSDGQTLVTHYVYYPTGELKSVNYSDGTPNVK